jgi:hypothetical protein
MNVSAEALEQRQKEQQGIPYIPETNPHSVLGDFLNGKES